MTDRVVEFKPKPEGKAEEFPATVKRRTYGPEECGHLSGVVVSEHERTVECRRCKVALDPLTVVADWAKRWDRERWSVRREKELDRMVARWHEHGGRITVRPSGVVVEREGKRWASSCSGGMTEQLDNALRRAGAAGLKPKE